MFLVPSYFVNRVGTRNPILVLEVIQFIILVLEVIQSNHILVLEVIQYVIIDT